MATTEPFITFMRGDIGWKGLEPKPVLDAFVDHKISLETRRQGRDLVARATIKNTSKRVMHLRGIRWVSGLSPLWTPPVIQFPREMEPHYFATENFRGDYYATTTTRGEHFFKPMPHEMVTLGFTEDAYFPGLFIASGVKERGLFCAAASSEKLSTMFRLFGGDGIKTWNFEIEQVPQGLPYVEIGPGRSFTGEWVYFSIADTKDPQQATDGYYRFLRKQGAFDRLKKNPLVRQHIWGTWNFGPMADVDEAFVLRQLPLLKAKMPTAKFVQLDHGYERIYPSGQRAQIDMFYDGEDPIDRRKFPEGMEGLTRKIREAGLRPAGWLGLWCAVSSPMIQENPDWVLRDDMGRVLKHKTNFASTNGRIGEICILDISQKAVQKHIDKSLKIFFGDWGFEGLKFDFYSIAFQVRRARFREGSRTAIELLRWLIDTCRKYMPADGFLGMCSAAGTGSPFLHTADYFRFAEDVSHGGWELCKRVALWTTNTYMLLQQHPVLPDIDSIGWSELFNDEQWKTYLALCAVSGGAFEVAGDLAKFSDARIEMLNRTMTLSDPLRRTRILDVPRGKIGLPPSLWVSQDARRGGLVAILNWDDRQREIATDKLDKAVPGWHEMERAWESSAEIREASVVLPAFGSLLLKKNAR